MTDQIERERFIEAFNKIGKFPPKIAAFAWDNNWDHAQIWKARAALDGAAVWRGTLSDREVETIAHGVEKRFCIAWARQVIRALLAHVAALRTPQPQAKARDLALIKFACRWAIDAREDGISYTWEQVLREFEREQQKAPT